MAPPRALNHTEELEKLEQSITLTLQQIDSNFAKAHRIVTSSILPIVERYAKNSESVLEGSKVCGMSISIIALTYELQFWKQFFEASGNITFNNYATPAIEESMVDTELGSEIDQSENLTEQEYVDRSRGHEEEDTDVTITSPQITTKIEHSDDDEDQDDDPILSSPSLAHNHSTPRALPDSNVGKGTIAGRHGTHKMIDYPSPYEAIKRELRGEKKSVPRVVPITPGKRPPALPDMTMTPVNSSPFGLPPQSALKNTNKDQVLHQGMLGMTYRVAATPMTARKKWLDPGSSPLGEEPQLRAEVFTSPTKPHVQAVKPGLSVMSPKKKETIEQRREERRRSLKELTGRTITRHDTDEDDPARGRAQLTMRSKLGWDSDDDDMPEFSPPKTLRFEFGEPKIIQTPGMLNLQLCTQQTNL